MHISRRDKVVTAILLTVIFLLLYLLQCHWRARFGMRGDAKPVGEVEYKYHKVQRKFSDRMLWEDVESKSPIYAYDWVMTKEKSDARITLNGGMKVDMDPESMVEIDETSEGVGLTLRDGTIRADTRSSTTGTITAADGTRIDLEKAEAHISTDGQVVSVDVKEGSATLKHNGKETRAAAGEVVNKTQAGVTKGKTVIALKSPMQEIVLDDPERPVDFAFEAPAGSDDCKILLNTGSKQDKVIRVKVGSTYSEKLSDGTYHWRATCQMAGEPVSSSTGVFRMRPAGSFALIAPAPGEVITANKSENIVLRWRATDKVQVELADNPGFSPLLKTAEVSEQSYALQNLKPGRYYWRIAQAGNKASKLQSDFTVSEKGELLTETDAGAKKPGDAAKPGGTQALQGDGTNRTTPAGEQKPVADGKKPAAPVSLKLSVSAPANVIMEPDASSAAVRVTWTPVRKEVNYLVRIATDRSFADEVTTGRASGKGSATVKLPPGSYYYRVSASRAGSEKSLGTSPVRRITVRRKELPPPPRVKSVQAE